MSKLSIEPGTILGKYRIDRVIGRGGGGHVYLAMQKGAGGFRRPVAIKVLHDAIEMTLNSRQRLAREARIIARLQHRNIVQVHELAEHGELQFLVMEYVDGTTLHGLLRGVGKRWPFWLGMHIGGEVARALQYAHCAEDPTGQPLGIVHRDIKPSNVLISRQGDVKLTDFGTAKASLVRDDHLTKHGIIKGTPAYMSPEHRLGMPATSASDVYSLAVVIYEMCTGRRLERAWDVDPCEPIAAYNPSVPAEFDDIMARALHTKDTNRPTAVELGRALQRALSAVTAPELLPRLNDETAIWVERGVAGLRPIETTDQTNVREVLDESFEEQYTSPAIVEAQTSQHTNVLTGRQTKVAAQQQPISEEPPAAPEPSDPGLLGRRMGRDQEGLPIEQLPPGYSDDGVDEMRRMIPEERRWHEHSMAPGEQGEPTRIESGTAEVVPGGLFGWFRRRRATIRVPRPGRRPEAARPTQPGEPPSPAEGSEQFRTDLEYAYRAQQTQLRIFFLVMFGLAAIALFLAWREGYVRWPVAEKPSEVTSPAKRNTP